MATKPSSYSTGTSSYFQSWSSKGRSSCSSYWSLSRWNPLDLCPDDWCVAWPSLGPYCGKLWRRSLPECIMGTAMIKGYQGDSLNDPTAIAACAKHFVAYGAAEGGRITIPLSYLSVCWEMYIFLLSKRQQMPDVPPLWLHSMTMTVCLLQPTALY